MYHRIGPGADFGGGLAVSPAHFAEQLEALRSELAPARLADVVAALDGAGLPARSVAVTFDDGYRDNLVDAKPLLERHDVPATVFVVSGYVGSGRRFWWDELEAVCARQDLPAELELEIRGRRRRWTVERGRERDLFRSLRGAFGPLEESERTHLLDRLGRWSGSEAPPQNEALSEDELRQLANGGLVEIGAHTATHPRLPDVGRARQLDEIRASRARLAELLDRDVRLFSYPFGAHDRSTVRSARAAGVSCACTTVPEPVTSASDAYRLPRIHVDDWPADELLRRLSAASGWPIGG